MYSTDINGREIKIQLPPLNSLRGNQWDSIFTNVRDVPPFDGLWDKGKDVLDEWSTIEKAVNEYLKHKAKESERRLEAVPESRVVETQENTQ